ncbi:hypothetical protein CEXT_779391 [Caerostris extrusa]|uniref:Uncharacterized protein n=1 Tax=Caerostris extrusa TaxID=172846 RepID=A0AAV4XE16_CAEEX|nr:hypothetical protein CEXT_779391 [Caerostris extrusa]
MGDHKIYQIQQHGNQVDNRTDRTTWRDIFYIVTGVHSQGIMGGFKGHNRGTGAVELLLATGILAKLLTSETNMDPMQADIYCMRSLTTISGGKP